MTKRQHEPPTAYANPPVAAHPDRACNGADPEIFYPLNNTLLKTARDICGRCPHRTECLDWAVGTRQAFGVWGGTTPEERAEMRRRAA